MARVRLREPRSVTEEAAYYGRTYPHGYRHDVWPDHVERVAASVEMIRSYRRQIRSAADLSCGDAAILRGCADFLDDVWLGDLNGVPSDVGELSDWRRAHRAMGVHGLPGGPLPDTLIGLDRPVDLFVLSETLEHMADPDDLLLQLTAFTRYLFLSTPVDEPVGSGNLEHYWGWGPEDIHDLFRSTGWHPLERKLLTPVSTLHLPDAYTYQLWMAVAVDR